MGMAKRESYDRSVIEKLDSIDWLAIMPGLIKYARAKEKLLIAVGSGKVYLDIIREAIARVYGQGENEKYRNWDSKKYPDLSKFLKYVIKDILRREVANLTGYQTEQLCWENEPGEERALSVTTQDDADAHQYLNPEDLIIKMETEKNELELAEKLSNTLNDISLEDEDLGLLILCIDDGKTKNARIAEETGFEISKVNNLKKKLKRRLKWYDKKYGISNNSERNRT